MWRRLLFARRPKARAPETITSTGAIEVRNLGVADHAVHGADRPDDLVLGDELDLSIAVDICGANDPVKLAGDLGIAHQHEAAIGHLPHRPELAIEVTTPCARLCACDYVCFVIVLDSGDL